MTLSRALPLVLALAVLPLAPAGAQFAAAPGMAPGMSPGMSGSPFGAPQQGPPPACQQLLSFRDDVAKHGQALQAAGKKKAGAEELCKLFKAFLAAESKMIKGLEERSAMCGVPADVIKQVKGSHGKASEMGKRICEVAAQGPRPSGPSLSDALGTTPMVPDSTGPKRGAGTFDTLEGSPLTR